MADKYLLTEAAVIRTAEAVTQVLDTFPPFGPMGDNKPIRRDVRWLGKTVGAISATSTGTVEIYSGATEGSEAATGETLTAYNRSSVEITDDTWVFIEFLGGMANSTWSIYWADVC